MAAIVRNDDHFDYDHFDYVITGGGCVGASTALAFIREWPDARIVWFEGTHTCTASQDISKIIRAAYEDEDYVAFLEKTLQMWQTDPLHREHYHQTGWVQVVGEGSHANTIKGPNDRMISVEEMLEWSNSRYVRSNISILALYLTCLEFRHGPVAATTYPQIHVLEANFTSHASILKEKLNICGGSTQRLMELNTPTHARQLRLTAKWARLHRGILSLFVLHSLTTFHL